jgi:hypothetical protein
MLQQAAFDDLDVFLSYDLAGAVRSEEGVIALPNLPPGRLDRLLVRCAEEGWTARSLRPRGSVRSRRSCVSALSSIWMAKLSSKS